MRFYKNYYKEKSLFSHNTYNLIFSIEFEKKSKSSVQYNIKLRKPLS